MKYKKAHGGELALGKRKTIRPVVTKRPIHIVFRSLSAKGPLSFLQPLHRRFIDTKVREVGKAAGVKIYQRGNSGNHIHLVVQARTRKGFQTFLRVFTGVVARKVTGAQRGRPFWKRFWDQLVWSRILEWGRDFIKTRKYVLRNELEGLGVIAYRPRHRKRGKPPP